MEEFDNLPSKGWLLGTLIVLGLLALCILWILVPLVKTGELPE